MAADRQDDVAAALRQLAAENARLVERLAEGEKRVRLLSRGVLRMQEAERARISRELHDGVGQSLTALKMQLELLAQRAEGSGVRTALGELSSLADGALQEVRQLSHLIRPPMLDQLGLLPTLRWLARTFQQRTGIEVALTSEGLDDGLDPDLATLVFRVAQESLTNVAKHARSSRAEIEVRRRGGSLSVRVRDHGRGFAVEEALASREGGSGLGLPGMRDRVGLFGGHFAVRSQPGEGTVIEVEVPLED